MVTKEEEDPTKVKVQGKKASQFLLMMSKDPDYYEAHRNSYLEELEKARSSLGKPKEDVEARRRQESEEREQKLFEERHRRIMQEIKIERPYLQNQALTEGSVHSDIQSEPEAK